MRLRVWALSARSGQHQANTADGDDVVAQQKQQGGTIAERRSG